jgi:uncharacterized spore protein YtfJ
MDQAHELGPKMLAQIFAAAQPGAVYGQPVVAASYTLITAAEVTSGGGFGFGMGLGPPTQTDEPSTESAGGCGGGGGAMGRPVAIVAVGPDGVTIKPVVDVTKIALTTLTASVSLLGLLRLMHRVGKS